MTSKAGLMPVRTKIESKTKWTSSITARRTLQTFKAAPPVKTGQSVRAPALSNVRRTIGDVKPALQSKRELAPKKAVPVISNILKNTQPASSKNPILTARSTTNMRKSHPSIFPGDKLLPKHTTPSRKSFAAGQRTPKSILKKEPVVPHTEKKYTVSSGCSDSHHVKFKSKATDQAQVRAKLNAWLEAKRKTPSANYYRHISCHHSETSGNNDRGVFKERTLTQDFLAHQMEVPKNEAVKKQLFKGKRHTLLKAHKENSQDGEMSCKDIMDSQAKINSKEAGDGKTEQNGEHPSLTDNDLSSSVNMTKKMMEVVILNKVLDECLHLFNSECPFESILAWFTEMESNTPEVLTFAMYYVYKTKVLAAFPQLVLDIFCQAVKNNAQPSEVLATEMKSYLSKRLTTKDDSNTTETVGEHIPSVTDIESVHSMDTGTTSDCSSPEKTNDTRRPTVCNLGSTIKYSISSTNHLVRQPPGTPATVGVVTPVRRSIRLSNKLLTPGTGLRRELDSVSDLSSLERLSMLFKNNPALTGE